MKRKSLTPWLKKGLVAVPAAALMLGAAQAQSTVGLNFQSWYYDSLATPQTIGFGAGYQTTGVPVTATAFGVNVADWFNSDPLPCQSAVSANIAFGGSLNAAVTAANMWESGYTAPGVWGPAPGVSWYASWPDGTNVLAAIAPGDYQVTWSFLDNTGWSVDVTGLNAKFPNGYVVGLVAGNKTTSTCAVDVTEDAGFTLVDTVTNFMILPDSMGLAASQVLTNDGITLSNPSRPDARNCAVAGLIFTDKPVNLRDNPANLLLASGSPLVLPTPTTIIGIGLTYQWMHDGTNIPGATLSSYTNASATTTDSGLYQVVVSSSYYPSISVTGQIASVSVVPTHAARTATWDADTGTNGAQDGSGTWSNTATNWWDGSVDDYWGSADTAVFGMGGAGPYTVTLADNISANALTFNSAGYTISNTSGEGITLQGAASVTANADATITTGFSTDTNTFLKAGTGALTLTGPLTCSSTFVSAGTLEVQAKGGDSPYVVTNGATLKIGYSTAGGYPATGLQLYGDGVAATTGLYLEGGANYNVSGGVVIDGAPTTIRHYGTGTASFNIFDINSNPGLSTTAAASGSVVDSNIEMVRGGYGMVITTAAGANTATGDLVLNGPLNINAANFAGGLNKKGNGSLRLNAMATTNNSGLRLLAGSVICGTDDCVGTNAFLDVRTDATFDLGTTSQTVSNANLAGTLKMTINKGGTPNALLSFVDPYTSIVGGSLVVTNIGSSFSLGDTVTLFIAPYGIGGGFTNVILPQLTSGLAWQNNLAVDNTIQVIAGVVPPSITTDLAPASYAYPGGTVSMTVVASGDPVLHYLWYKNGTTPVGTDSPTLSLSPVSLSDSGYYSVTVTNLYGTAQSISNYLTLATPDLAASTALADGPQSLWPLAETVGPTAYDYLGSHHGTHNGGLTLAAVGPRPPENKGFSASKVAYQFDGATSFIDCGTAPSLSGTTDFTVEAWINTTNASGRIIQQRDSTGNGYIGQYALGVSGGGVNFFVYNSGYQFNLTTARTVNDGKWHHIAGVRSGTNGIVYIDGSVAASGSGAVQALNGALVTYIGADERDHNNRFGGSMCDVAIYNSALSPDRIGQHAYKGIMATDPIVLSAVPGGFIEDSKPAGTLHHGINGGSTWVASSTDVLGTNRVGVRQFNLSQIAIPADADFNTTNGTIMFWAKAAAPLPGPGNEGAMLVDRRTGSGTVVVLKDDGTIFIQCSGGANSFSAGYLPDDLWHHVAVTYNQAAGGTIEIYVDGNLAGSQANTSAWSWPAAQQIEIGKSHDGYWKRFNGQMDDFRIYNRILTQPEVASVAGSDALVDTAALKVRYNFGTAAGVGTSFTWPLGTLQSTPALNPPAWTPISGAFSPYPWLLPAPSQPTNPAVFYRIKL